MYGLCPSFLLTTISDHLLWVRHCSLPQGWGDGVSKGQSALPRVDSHRYAPGAWGPASCLSALCLRATTHCAGFLGDTGGKEATSQCRRHKRRGFNPWFRKIAWRRKWQPTPVFLPGQRSLVGYSP